MPHYYDAEQEGPLKPHPIWIAVRGLKLQLQSAKGVFSKDELDEGTKLLIEGCTIEPGWRVHDLGCGTGVVGIVVKKIEPSCIVVCTDVSKRAVELTQLNATELNLELDVRQSDGYAVVPELFDTVLLNPPYVAGREVIYRLIQEAYDHLKEEGMLQLVARHRKGGEMLKIKMEEIFGNCDDREKSRGFRIYKAKKFA